MLQRLHVPIHKSQPDQREAVSHRQDFLPCFPLSAFSSQIMPSHLQTFLVRM